jgi:hypothetical protein
MIKQKSSGAIWQGIADVECDKSMNECIIEPAGFIGQDIVGTRNSRSLRKVHEAFMQH